MNFLGENIDNALVGDVDVTGDITVSGSGTFENINVTDTATINTLITQQELVVEDPIILMGKNNPSDNVNLGILEELKDVVKRWSGLLRDRVTKKQHLFRN